ncbi:MAG: glycosyltransferase family 4 protein [candidate division KSB1 bacterium]|nr:glycosyltransferase family 4 protein [candidate division KSB1 bacterium]
MNRVYFIDLPNRKIDTASYNRFLSLTRMAGYYFDTKIFKATDVTDIFRKNTLIRGLAIRASLMRASFNIVKVDKAHNNSVVYLFGVDPIMSIYYFILFKSYRIKIVSERNELPIEIINNKHRIVSLYKRFLYPWLFKLFDGYSVISSQLQKFYSSYTGERCQITLLPMTVDFSRFENVLIDNNKDVKFIFYAGSLDQSKDGINHLIRAFLRVHKKLLNWELWIAGISDDSSDIVCSTIGDPDFEKKVKFLGLVSRDKIPALLLSSEVCVLPRPDSLQARHGFPAKLGEYLASGKPVITTNVGEIPSYLSKEEVFYISKDTIEVNLAETLLFVYSHYDQALEKGQRGRQKAYQVFSLQKNAEILRDFINGVISQ